MSTQEKSAPTIHIKKYGNRRLYSSAETRFITIDELATLVRRGQKVKVTDAETGEDITAEVLTQILLENGRAQHFPIEMLEQMIRMNEEALKTFWGTYLNQSLQMLQTLQSTFQNFNPFLSFLKPTDSFSASTSSRSEEKPRKRAAASKRKAK